MGMNWTKLTSHPKGFTGAKACMASDRHLLAKWDHYQCRGWQLYHRRSLSKTTWLASAGAESLDWSDEQVMQWADTVVKP